MAEQNHHDEDGSEDILTQGLIDYFSSQADLMLCQYKNINHLLGPTREWTHPGTLCEELLKDFLRRSLVAGVSADKGYIYGRTSGQDNSKHSPEIDILIHDTSRFRPIFQMGDLVIVRPEAVLGIIQVKRTLTSTQLDKGLVNIIDAKALLHQVMYASRAVPISPYIFSGVVGFEDKRNSTIDSFRKLCIRLLNREHQELIGSRCPDQATALHILPNFIGSIRGHYSFTPIDESRRGEYYVQPSVVKCNYVVPQTLCALVNGMIGRVRNLKPDELPPIAFPEDRPRSLNAFFIRPVTKTNKDTGQITEGVN